MTEYAELTGLDRLYIVTYPVLFWLMLRTGAESRTEMALIVLGFLLIAGYAVRGRVRLEVNND